MYSYDYVDGTLLSNVTDENVMKNFLNYCQDNLWTTRYSNDKLFFTDNSFLYDCREMYETKTKQRIKKLFNSKLDRVKFINGVEVKPIEELLDKIDWNSFQSKSIPVPFHGDLQPENIVYNETTNDFTLIDWRQSFGDSIDAGDVYYDLSKL